MPFVLDPNRPVDVEIRRVTRERLNEAVRLLDSVHDADALEIERVVHDVRKRCKEVRATARLVRSALGDDFDRFNATVRSAAEELAPIRDAHAVLATFDDLRATTGRSGDDPLDAVSDAQRAVADAATESIRASDPRIRRARKLLAVSTEAGEALGHSRRPSRPRRRHRHQLSPGSARRSGESPTHRPMAGCTSGARRSSTCGTRSDWSRHRHPASSNPSAPRSTAWPKRSATTTTSSVLVDRLARRP